MRRLSLGALVLACAALLLGAFAVTAQDPDGALLERRLDGVLVGVRNDVALPAGRATDTIVIVDGAAVIEGTAKSVFAYQSDVTLQGPGARVDHVLTFGGRLTAGPGASVGDISYVDTFLEISPEAERTGLLRDIENDITGSAGAIAAGVTVLLILLWIGWAISTLVAGLLMVAFGSSQARRATWLIGNHPFKVLGAGLLALILPPIVFLVLAVTGVGLPLAFGLMVLWIFIVFLGYLVAGLWIGERLMPSTRMKDRPYIAVFVGLLILLLLSWIPLVTAIATWFGLGAVTMAGWRVLRGGSVRGYPPAWGTPYAPPPGYPQPGPYAPQGPAVPAGYPPGAYPPAGYPPPAYPQEQWQWPGQEQWPPQDRYPPQGPPASWPG